MATALELQKSLKSVNVKDTAISAMVATVDAYVELNRKQMQAGKGKNQNIGRYRNPQYAQFKASLYPDAGPGNVDLRLTGDFQARMKGEIAGEEIMVTSEDPKTEKLESSDKYGTNIWGLNAGTQPTYNEEHFLPEFLTQIEKQTGLSDGLRV